MVHERVDRNELALEFGQAGHLLAQGDLGVGVERHLVLVVGVIELLVGRLQCAARDEVHLSTQRQNCAHDGLEMTSTEPPAARRLQTDLVDLDQIVELVELLVETGAADLARLVQQVEVEEFALVARVAVVAHVRLVRHSSFDRPSAGCSATAPSREGSSRNKHAYAASCGRLWDNASVKTHLQPNTSLLHSKLHVHFVSIVKDTRNPP